MLGEVHRVILILLIDSCPERFAHSNRKCSIHPEYRLKRDGKEEIQFNDNMTDKEIQWLKEYKENKGKPAKRKKITKPEDTVKRQCSSPTPSSSGVSSASPQEEEIPLQMPTDSAVIEAARILCSFTSGAT